MHDHSGWVMAFFALLLLVVIQLLSRKQQIQRQYNTALKGIKDLNNNIASMSKQLEKVKSNSVPSELNEAEIQLLPHWILMENNRHVGFFQHDEQIKVRIFPTEGVPFTLFKNMNFKTFEEATATYHQAQLQIAHQH